MSKNASQQNADTSYEHVHIEHTNQSNVKVLFAYAQNVKKQLTCAMHKNSLCIIFRLDKSAGLILKLFGPKFHPDFPNERRGATGGCPPGIWATTTDDHYKTLGVDLKLEAGKPVRHFFKSFLTI